MFSNFSDRVLKTFDGLLSRGVLTDNDVNSAMREIRVALLEADVPLNIAKDFVEKVEADGDKKIVGIKIDDTYNLEFIYKEIEVKTNIIDVDFGGE